MATAFGMYKGKVVRALNRAGFKGDALALAECLDMSFEECKIFNHTIWDDFIKRDLEAFKQENPHEFSQ